MLTIIFSDICEKQKYVITTIGNVSTVEHIK